MNTQRTVFALLALGTLLLPMAAVHADNAGPQNVAPSIAQSGAEIYADNCQGCHMADARGAVGAATIPALAGNPHLGPHGYPILVVLYGHGAMPAFGSLLDDAQEAAVLNYVRQNFGNHFTDPVTPSEVKAARIPGKAYASGF